MDDSVEFMGGEDDTVVFGDCCDRHIASLLVGYILWCTRVRKLGILVILGREDIPRLCFLPRVFFVGYMLCLGTEPKDFGHVRPGGYPGIQRVCFLSRVCLVGCILWWTRIPNLGILVILGRVDTRV